MGFGAVLQMFALSDYQKIKVLLLEDLLVQNVENKLKSLDLGGQPAGWQVGRPASQVAGKLEKIKIWKSSKNVPLSGQTFSLIAFR